MIATDRPTAGSPAVRAVLAVPAEGRVLAAFPSALYVGLDGSDVVAVVTSDGLALPNALVLAATSRSAPFAAHRPGEPAAVRDGVLLVGSVGYRAVRWRAGPAGVPADAGPVRAAVVDALARRLVDPHAGELAVVLRTAIGRLRAALSAGDVAAARSAADSLLGLGAGLTPSGDDVLAGALVTCSRLRATPGVAGPAATADALGRHVRRVASVRTCALSASLLRHAADGRAAPPVLDLVDALVGRRPLTPALDALLDVGHTSGADTARGILAAAQAAVRSDPPEVR